MSSPTAQVRVSLDKAQAERDAEGLGRTLRDALVPVVDIAEAATWAFDQFKDAVRGAYEFVREGVIASAEAAALETRLEQALRIRGQTTGGLVEAMNDYNAAMMQSTGIADDALLSLETQLVALGVTRDRLVEATQAAVGLSEITGRDLSASATAVAKVLEGNIGALKRMGIETDSVAEAMELLTRSSALAGASMGTAAGQYALLTQNVGELQEAIGSPIARSDGLIGAMKGANETLVGMTAAVERLGDAANDAAGGDALGLMGASLVELARTQFPTAVSALEAVTGGFRSMGRAALDAGEDARKAAQAVVDAENSIVTKLAEGVGGLTRQEILDRFGRRRQSGVSPEDLAKAQRAEEEAYRQRLRDYTPDQFVGPVDRDLENFRLIEQREELARELAREHERQLTEIAAAGNEARFQEELADYDRREAARSGFVTSAVDMVAQFGGALAANLGAAARSGADAGDVVLQALGGIMTTIGSSLIGLGSAGLAAATLGTVAPWLLPVTGGPAAVPASLAAIALGGLLAAGGGFLAAAAPRAPAAASGRRTGGGGGARTEADQQTFGGRPDAPLNPTFVVQVNGGVWGMDTPRALQDLLDRNARLEPRRRGGW